jgi:hypothetical protein
MRELTMRRLLLRGVLVFLLAATAAGQQAGSPAPAGFAGDGVSEQRRPWVDVNDAPLPFTTDEELLDYLRTADVVAQKEISTGVTVPLKLTLEKNGVRAHAVFRRLDEEKPAVDFGHGEREMFFRDSYLFEPAAYEISRMLGMDNVPPATLRKVHGTLGSVQIWVEHAQTEEQRTKSKTVPPDARHWAWERQRMLLFDALVYNTDRTRNNILITPDWKVWLIDHTRAFRRRAALRDEDKIEHCDRDFYQRLQALDEKTLRARLRDYLRPGDISTLMKRRDLLVRRLQKLIAQRGEDAVLTTPSETRD